MGRRRYGEPCGVVAPSPPLPPAVVPGMSMSMMDSHSHSHHPHHHSHHSLHPQGAASAFGSRRPSSIRSVSNEFLPPSRRASYSMLAPPSNIGELMLLSL